MKQIYIILTRSTTLISRIISRFTGESYTHASIAFDDSLGVMYSFARKYAQLPLPAGLMEEHIDSAFYRMQGNIPCKILCMNITDREYYHLRTIVYNMLCRADEYRYSVIGLLLCQFSIPLEIPDHFFCSQFVAKILEESGILKLPKPAALMHPADFLTLDPLCCVFDGGLCELYASRNGLSA